MCLFDSWFPGLLPQAVVAHSRPQSPAPPLVLPPSLRNSVAVLDAPNPSVPGGVTKVYVLGMSHVSKASCDQVGVFMWGKLCVVCGGAR